MHKLTNGGTAIISAICTVSNQSASNIFALLPVQGSVQAQKGFQMKTSTKSSKIVGTTQWYFYNTPTSCAIPPIVACGAHYVRGISLIHVCFEEI